MIRDKKIAVFGMNILNVKYEELIEIIKYKIKHRKKVCLFTPNLQHFLLYHNNYFLQSSKEKNIAFKKAYDDADICVLDSRVIFLFLKLKRIKIKENITGIDLTEKLLCVAEFEQYKIAFVGGKDSTYERLRKMFPSLGFHHYTEELHSTKTILKINMEKPDIIFVSLGTPKQELWIKEKKEELGATIIIGIGSSLEHITHELKRAPIIFQRCGLEWFYRCIRYPRRYLWRYMYISYRLLVSSIRICRKK